MWILLSLVGCLHRNKTEVLDPVPDLLARADRAWEERATGGLEPVEELLGEAWQADLHRPDTQWRLARLYVEQGLAEEDRLAALGRFAEARAMAIDCLDQDTNFKAARDRNGLNRAVGRILLERQGCAAWAGMAWTRWIEAMGAEAAAVDLPAVDALNRAGQLGPEAPTAIWAEGILLAIRPEWAGRNRDRAASLIAGTPGQQQHAWQRAADVLFNVAIPAGDPTQVRTVADAPPETPDVSALCERFRAAPEGPFTPADARAIARGKAACRNPYPDPEEAPPGPPDVH